MSESHTDFHFTDEVNRDKSGRDTRSVYRLDQPQIRGIRFCSMSEDESADFE